MKKTTSLFALCLISGFMPVTTFADKGRTGPGDHPPYYSMISPIMVEITSNGLNVIFSPNLGEVNVLIENEDIMVYDNLVDTSVQNQNIYNLPSGTYGLTITTTEGLTLLQTTILIP